MAVGQFLTIRNYQMFEHVGRSVVQAVDMDPALAFQSALPGFLGEIYEDIGAWKGREQKAFEFPGAQGAAKAISANERARMGGFGTQQVVARPGFEIAGETQTVYPSDFMYGGMDQSTVTRRAMRPRLDWNKLAFEKALDVATQGGKSTGAPVEEFAYTATDFQGNTVTKALVTESATEAADVIANATQSILWPLRAGGVASVNHDHNLTGGGAWTLANAATARDRILEHPGNGSKVRAYVGTTVATAIRAVLKTEAANTMRAYDIATMSAPLVAPIAGATVIALGIQDVDYYAVPDMDVNQALYVAEGKKPFYFSKGQLGENGAQVGTGQWFETENPETRGNMYGYRDYLNLGVKDPTAAVIVDNV